MQFLIRVIQQQTWAKRKGIGMCSCCFAFEWIIKAAGTNKAQDIDIGVQELAMQKSKYKQLGRAHRKYKLDDWPVLLTIFTLKLDSLYSDNPVILDSDLFLWHRDWVTFDQINHQLKTVHCPWQTGCSVMSQSSTSGRSNRFTLRRSQQQHMTENKKPKKING